TGYPGWVPSRQLSPWSAAFAVQDGQNLAMVTAAFTRLHSTAQELGIELAFLTKLPLVEDGSEWVKVAVPDGEALLPKADVAIVRANEPIELTGNRGEAIVESGKRFLDL
ncbi:peptidase, partial [Mesorhizobium sp. M00.F.Ca.ET.186.01.1.1]